MRPARGHRLYAVAFLILLAGMGLLVLNALVLQPAASAMNCGNIACSHESLWGPVGWAIAILGAALAYAAFAVSYERRREAAGATLKNGSEGSSASGIDTRG